MVCQMTEDEAKRNFITINSTAKRVSLNHRLKVDPSEWSKLVRDLSTKFKISISNAHSVLIGLVGSTEYYNGTYSLDGIDNKATLVLKCWTSGKKWDRKVGVYATSAVLKMVSGIVKESKDIISTLTELSDMDFSKDGPLGRSLGMPFTAQKAMRDYAYRHLAKKII